MGSDRTIVFDLDDTLYPERSYAFSGFAAVASAFERELGAADKVAGRMRELFATSDRRRIFDVVIDEKGHHDTPDLLDRMIQAYRTHTPAIALHSDADAALTRLRTTCKLALITDGFSASQHAKIDALNIRPRLDLVIVTDDWGRPFWKPHPRAFEEVQHYLNVAPDQCTYVADNPAKDFFAPNALGWRTIRIDRPDAVHNAGKAPPGGEPGRVITTLAAL